MSRVDDHRAYLRSLPAAQWPGYLTANSALPGPRANLELAAAVGEEADPTTIESLLDTGDEYLVFCGVRGLGRLLAEDDDVEARLRQYATDDRWRVREAVAMALQRCGADDLPRTLDVCRRWAEDPDPLVQRAALAGICEPGLLTSPAAVTCALDLCQRCTSWLVGVPAAGRKDPGVRTLRKALGYCWSVAVAADPSRGLPRFEQLEVLPDDPDVRWIVRENRKKSRLARLL